jgi:hypothetical protein
VRRSSRSCSLSPAGRGSAASRSRRVSYRAWLRFSQRPQFWMRSYMVCFETCAHFAQAVMPTSGGRLTLLPPLLPQGDLAFFLPGIQLLGHCYTPPGLYVRRALLGGESEPFACCACGEGPAGTPQLQAGGTVLRPLVWPRESHRGGAARGEHDPEIFLPSQGLTARPARVFGPASRTLAAARVRVEGQGSRQCQAEEPQSVLGRE